MGNKKYELQNIDDFIRTFNSSNLYDSYASIKRVSDDKQESPDAILLAGNGMKIALEATMVFAANQRPHEPIQTEAAYNPNLVIDEVIKAIKKKSHNSYRGPGIDETWLLISGGSYISDHDITRRSGEFKENTFDRVFIHKGIAPALIEIVFD